MPDNFLTDFELWEFIVKDDSAAFTILFKRYWHCIFNVAYFHLKDKETSEEIVHDIFFDLWNRRQKLKVENFKNYLSKAAKYQVYSRAKAAKLVPVTFVEYLDNVPNEISFNNADKKFSYDEIESRINDHLKNLPKRCSEIFKMSRLQQMSNLEIAEVLGISKRTVENQITAATKYLKVVFKNFILVLLMQLLS